LNARGVLWRSPIRVGTQKHFRTHERGELCEKGFDTAAAAVKDLLLLLLPDGLTSSPLHIPSGRLGRALCHRILLFVPHTHLK
jgi:hypothetical protein